MVPKRYRLLTQLGAGFDAISYSAVATTGGARVELRDLEQSRADWSRWSRLVARVKLVMRLAHPVSISVLDAELEDTAPFVAMEWVEATTLAEHTLRTGPLPAVEAMKLAAQLASALEEAHRLGLAHGRLGPSQVLLDEGLPRLDFTGIDCGFPNRSAESRALDANCRDPKSATGAGVGDAVAREGDLYALGVMLVWLMTGETGSQARSACIDDPETGPCFGELIRDLLAAEPSDRPTAYEVVERLAGPARQNDVSKLTIRQQNHETGDWSNVARLMPPSAQFGAATVDLAAARVSFGSEMDRDMVGRRLGRYRLLDLLGEGGQGRVYRAEDSAEGSIVAIKLLRTERSRDAAGLRRFRKEARLMAEANNPHIVNLLEYNEEDGKPYLVLEFVSGEGLDHLLERSGKLNEREALAIMAEVARGLAAAHERGIVHRDIKPSNIFVLEPDAANGSKSALRIKISDFGLARHVVDSASLALTTDGALMGTPLYMAPEQWTGRMVDARTDVYALGVTLYHLLAGRPPFEATSRDELASQHCFMPLLSASPSTGVSEAATRVIWRAMAKQPEDRYVDAGAMLRDLEALLHGKPTGIPMHPILPSCPPERISEFIFQWDLESSPRALWSLVTNTDRLDHAIGFPAVNYTTRYDEEHGVRTFSAGRKLGMAEVGEEHPYEWVEPRRMGVLREYKQGPFVWVVSTVELLPRPSGGTTLVHRLTFEPRTWMVRIDSRWRIGIRLRKNLGKTYRRIDSTIQARERRGGLAVGPSASNDPFEEAERLPALRRERLESLLDTLSAKGVAPLTAERLGEFLTMASPQELARIRPLTLADHLGLNHDDVVAACLHGAREGLLELYWDLVCPVCRLSTRITDTLRDIEEHANCIPCNLEFQPDFASSIEMIFKVHPEIRRAEAGDFHIGGPPNSPHVLAQVRLAPSERIELDLALPEGSYRLRGMQLAWGVNFAVRGAVGSRRWEVELTAGMTPAAPAGMPAGSQVLALTNRHDRELVIRVENTAGREHAVTAARAASLALFRELFPGEVLAPGLLATVSTVTFLVTALDRDQADALYQTMGDARATTVVREHLRLLGDAIRQGGGAVIKTQGEGLEASFSDVGSAVRTAITLTNRLADVDSTQPLRMMIGVDHGTALAATVNDQLDYFGTTARRVWRLLSYAQPGDIVLTRAVASDPEVASLLSGERVTAEIIPVNLDGSPHAIRIHPRAIDTPSSIALSDPQP